MTDGQILFVLICLLYLSECALWLSRHSIVFISMLGAGFKTACPSVYLGSPTAGLTFKHIFPFIGNTYVCDLSSVSFSPIGICAYNPQTLSETAPPQPGTAFRFEEIEKITSSEKNIYINQTFFVKCITPQQAESIVLFTKSIINTSTDRQQSLIHDHVKKTFETERLKEKLSNIKFKIWILRLLCDLLFYLLFVFSPVLSYRFGLPRVIIPVAIAMFCLALLISIEFYRCHKKIYPGLKSKRITTLIKMILCPPEAIRAADAIELRAISEFNPIAAGNVLMKEKYFLEFARQYLRDIKHPVESECEGLAAEIVRSSNDKLYSIAEEYIKTATSISDDLLPAPKPHDDFSIAYCPRCLNQFRKKEETCHDCKGVKLVCFSDE